MELNHLFMAIRQRFFKQYDGDISRVETLPVSQLSRRIDAPITLLSFADDYSIAL